MNKLFNRVAGIKMVDPSYGGKMITEEPTLEIAKLHIEAALNGNNFSHQYQDNHLLKAIAILLLIQAEKNHNV